MDFESFFDGVMLHIGIQEGKGAPVDSILAIIGAAGEDVSSLLSGDAPAKVEVAVNTETPAKAAETTVAAPATISSSASSDNRLKASPLAKKIAEDKGIDLSKVQGSGDEGRIVKKDVENFTPAKQNSVATVAYTGVESYTEEPVSQMRKTIARRLAESKFSAPHFYLKMEVEMSQAIESRKAINELSPVKISFNDLVVKAVAIALRSNPKVNSSWLGDKIRYNNHINIGVAMAVEDGLLVPVVRFADNKSLSQIASEVKVYSQKAKDKKLQPSDWEGNTFTISNLGMYGIDDFTAIINPPDACILAVGGIKETPIIKNGQIVPGNIMKLTLSCDHRVVDGATGAAFLQSIKQLLENPVTMLI
jgi:pyruvate dehydrogenase E2 component (dihydrolipoamide acetyltransferase)